MEVVYDIPDNVEFISHGKLVKNYIVFVEDHKRVKCYDIINKRITLLFTMQSQIIAFDVLDLDDKPQLDQESKEQIRYGDQVADITLL